jgi:hypothetical protein
MPDRPKHWRTLEELTDLPNPICLIFEPVEPDYIVDYEVRAKTARETANRRWRMEQIAFGEANDKR